MTEENHQQELVNSLGKMFTRLENENANFGNYSLEGFAENGTKRMRKNDEKEGIEEKEEVDRVSTDPLVVFGSDIMNFILSRFDSDSLAPCLLVSRRWHVVAGSDMLWSPLCNELWRGKAHIPRMVKLSGLSKLSAYSISIMDGKRTRFKKEDLCDHVWEFRFNEGAPEYWRNIDLSWEGNESPPMVRYFHPVGSQTVGLGDKVWGVRGNESPPMVRYFHPVGSQTVGLGDKVWGGHEASYCTVTGINVDDTVRTHYVRINSWPPLTVVRKNDWRWEMYGNLVRYTSIPDSDKEEGTGPLFIGF